jgi:thiosulfate dehydrogenase [quinone] large subunit
LSQPDRERFQTREMTMMPGATTNPNAQGSHAGKLSRWQQAQHMVRSEAQKDGMFLVPVRVFIGIGWLRAFSEKAIDLDWWRGRKLEGFLTMHLQDGRVAFPPYQALVSDVFLPHALLLSLIVMFGQLFAGLAIMTGTLTNLALAGGLFMNLNFLLLGVPDPSAFYIVIQVVLLMTGAGAILGVDAWLHDQLRVPWLAARPPGSRLQLPRRQRKAAAFAALAIGFALYSLVHIRDWSPRGSVHDPAAILTTLATMSAAWAVIVYLRGEQRWNRYRTDEAHDQGEVRSFVEPAGWSMRSQQLPAERIPGSGWD